MEGSILAFSHYCGSRAITGNFRANFEMPFLIFDTIISFLNSVNLSTTVRTLLTSMNDGYHYNAGMTL